MMANEKRLIDANAFKMFLEDVRQDYLEEDTFSSDFAAKVIETVQDEYLALAPTVDSVEVVHGRWLYDSGSERCFCSVCNETALYTSKDEPIFDYDWEENLRYSHTETYLEEHLTNYCPNCGADMR